MLAARDEHPDPGLLHRSVFSPRVALTDICHERAAGTGRQARPGSGFGTVHVMPDLPIPVPARGRDPPPLRPVLRGARPHGRAQRLADAGRRPDAALHQLRHGPVQGRADRPREAQLRPRRRLPALPARGRQAQRLRGSRPDAAPSHPVRDAGQLELRRLLQARGDPLGLGAADRGLRDPGRSAGGDRLQDDDEAYGIWHDEIGLPPERIARWGNVEAGDDANFWRMAETGPCGRCSRDPLRPRGGVQRGAALRSGPLASTARAGSRSGTWSSWSSSSAPTARACRCR